jgi:hypothetical protein
LQRILGEIRDVRKCAGPNRMERAIRGRKPLSSGSPEADMQRDPSRPLQPATALARMKERR